MFPYVPREDLHRSNAFFAAGRRQPPVTFGQNFATLQNPQSVLMNQLARSQAKEVIGGIEDQQTMVENLGPMVSNDMADPELARAQLARGGDYLRSIQPEGTAQPVPTATGFDYSGVKPMRGGDEELFQNPKFSALARTNPTAAAKVYKAVTGRDLGQTLELRRKTEVARTKDFTETIRGAIGRGDVRQNPETGLIERKTKMADPNNPTVQVETWEPAEAEFQGIASQHWEQATGQKVARPNPISQMGIPPKMQPLLLSLYRKHLGEEGATPQSAMRKAVESLPSTEPMVVNAPPPSHTAKANPPPPPEAGPAAYNAWATAQAQTSATDVSKSIEDTVMGFGSKVDYAGNDASRIMQNMGKGLFNLPNRISTMFGGGPMYDWARPESKDEMIKRMARPVDASPQAVKDFESQSSDVKESDLFDEWNLATHGGRRSGISFEEFKKRKR